MSGSDNSLCGRKKGHHVQWRLFRSIPDLCPQIIVVYLAVFIIRNDCRQCEVSVCVCVCGIGEQGAVQNCSGWPLGMRFVWAKGPPQSQQRGHKVKIKGDLFFLSCGLSISSVFLFYLPTFPLIKAQCVPSHLSHLVSRKRAQWQCYQKAQSFTGMQPGNPKSEDSAFQERMKLNPNLFSVWEPLPPSWVHYS